MDSQIPRRFNMPLSQNMERHLSPYTAYRLSSLEDNHESRDRYIDYEQPTQRLYHPPQGPQFPPSHQMAQLQASGQTPELSACDQMSQRPFPPTVRPPLPQPPQLEERSRPSEEAPFYVNAKQFERILKRRVTRQRYQEQSGGTPRKTQIIFIRE